MMRRELQGRVERLVVEGAFRVGKICWTEHKLKLVCLDASVWLVELL